MVRHESENENENKHKAKEIMGWVRLVITIAAYIATVLVWGARMETKINDHIFNNEIHTPKYEMLQMLNNSKAVMSIEYRLTRMETKLDKLVDKELGGKK